LEDEGLEDEGLEDEDLESEDFEVESEDFDDDPLSLEVEESPAVFTELAPRESVT
jgi:hypothetical protein